MVFTIIVTDVYIHVFQCQCCSSDSVQIKCTMPDTCIVYKLHLECGQLINLYDWMQVGGLGLFQMNIMSIFKLQDAYQCT